MTMESPEETRGATYGRLIPLSKWPHYHIWPTIAGLRGLILRQQENGFTIAVRKVGKKILIDERAFFEWVNSRSSIETKH